MADLSGLAGLISAATASLTAAAGGGVWLYKRRPAKAKSMADEVADIKHDMRILTDYVHDLREHIALGKPPPPPDWPEGLRL